MQGKIKAEYGLKICLLLSVVCITAFFTTGCGTHPAGYATLKTADNAELPNWPYSIEVIERPDGSKDYFWEIDSHIEQGGSTVIKYHREYDRYHFAVVEGSIEPAGGRYPVVIDTGASQPLLVKKVHVRQNKLRVKRLDTKGPNGNKIDLCHLPQLSIGTTKLINWPCLRLKSHWLGFGVRDDFVIVGMPVLREFSYIRFDNIRRELELSKDKVFSPGRRDSWQTYPIWLEEDFGRNVFLFVRIPIAGKELELQVDTGSGRGLALSQNLWEEISGHIPQVRLRKDRELYPYIGNLSCQKGTVDKLKVGSATIQDVPVSVYADDSPLVEDCDGLIGMRLFENAVIVLDFKQELMWLKRM